MFDKIKQNYKELFKSALHERTLRTVYAAHDALKNSSTEEARAARNRHESGITTGGRALNRRIRPR